MFQDICNKCATAQKRPIPIVRAVTVSYKCNHNLAGALFDMVLLSFSLYLTMPSTQILLMAISASDTFTRKNLVVNQEEEMQSQTHQTSARCLYPGLYCTLVLSSAD